VSPPSTSPRQRRHDRVNITALTELTRLFVPAIAAAGRVNNPQHVASVAGFVPGPAMSVSLFETKHYVLAFSYR